MLSSAGGSLLPHPAERDLKYHLNDGDVRMFKIYSPERDRYIIFGVCGAVFALLLNVLLNAVLPKGHTFAYMLLFPFSNLFYELFPAWSSDWYYFLNSLQYALYFIIGGMLFKSVKHRKVIHASAGVLVVLHVLLFFFLQTADKTFLRDVSWMINSFFPESFLYL